MDDLESEEPVPMKSLFSYNNKNKFLKHPIALFIVIIFILTIIFSIYKKYNRSRSTNFSQRTDDV